MGKKVVEVTLNEIETGHALTIDMASASSSSSTSAPSSFAASGFSSASSPPSSLPLSSSPSDDIEEGENHHVSLEMDEHSPLTSTKR